jgi:pilus assembly protein CpaE
MPQTATQTVETHRMAAFTVCADGELNATIQHAISRIPHVQFSGDFPEYITGNRQPHFPEAVTNASCSVALINFDKDRDRALETAEALERISSLRIASVGISSHIDSALLMRAMRSGFAEFLAKPVSASDLAQVLSRMQTRIAGHQGAFSAPGQVISVFGAKGGVGATTVAVHLATYLAKKHKKRTLLVDHHHQLGHTSLYLGIKDNQYYFNDLIGVPGLLDADLLKGFVRRHSSGLDVLASPDKLAPPHQSTSEQFQASTSFLRRQYEYIVIDSSLHYGEMTAAIFAASDKIYVVATPDIAAIRDLSRCVEQLILDEAVKSRLQVVVNRKSARDTFGLRDIETAIHIPVSCSIPNSYKEVEHAINAGEPVPPGTHSEFCSAISRLVSTIVAAPGRDSDGVQRKRRFSLW